MQHKRVCVCARVWAPGGHIYYTARVSAWPSSRHLPHPRPAGAPDILELRTLVGVYVYLLCVLEVVQCCSY